jgi:hypothetical protein
VLDLAQSARTVDDAIGWLTRAVGGRIHDTGPVARRDGRAAPVRWRRESGVGAA